MAEGRVAGKAPCQDVPCGGEFLADESEPEEPGAHRVFRILFLLFFWAGRPHILRHLGKRQAELDVAFELSGVEPVASAVRRGVELEKPELDRPFGEGGVEVEHVVAAAVVVLTPAVVLVLAAVPDVRKLRHRGRLLFIELRFSWSRNRGSTVRQ